MEAENHTGLVPHLHRSWKESTGPLQRVQVRPRVRHNKEQAPEEKVQIFSLPPRLRAEAPGRALLQIYTKLARFRCPPWQPLSHGHQQPQHGQYVVLPRHRLAGLPRHSLISLDTG